VWSQFAIHWRYRQTDRRTDGRTSRLQRKRKNVLNVLNRELHGDRDHGNPAAKRVGMGCDRDRNNGDDCGWGQVLVPMQLSSSEHLWRTYKLPCLLSRVFIATCPFSYTFLEMWDEIWRLFFINFIIFVKILKPSVKFSLYAALFGFDFKWNKTQIALKNNYMTVQGAWKSIP